LCVNFFSIAQYQNCITSTSSELQGKEEAACTLPAYTTASVLFTDTNTVNIAGAVT